MKNKCKFKLINDEYDEVIEFVSNSHGKSFRTVKQSECDNEKTILEASEDVIISLMNFLNGNYTDMGWRMIRVGIDDYTDIFDLGGDT